LDSPPRKRDEKKKDKKDKKKRESIAHSELISLSSNNAENKAESKDKKRKSKSVMGSMPSNDASMVKGVIEKAVLLNDDNCSNLSD